ncbi:MAG: type IV pilus secretin PilQ [Cellvibrionaceae bacterium]
MVKSITMSRTTTNKVLQRVAAMVDFRIAIIVLGTLFGAGPVFSATLNDLKFSELPGGAVEIRAEFSEPPAVPKGYSIEQPARIVLDFEKTESNLKEKKFPLSFGNAKSAVVLTSAGRTRFIINLVSASSYRTSVEGNTLVTIIDGTSKSTTFTRQQENEETRQTFTDKIDRSITEVDFRRTEKGEGNILLTLSDPMVAVDIEESASGIIVNFVDTDLPQNLRRRLDVVDFATPVKIIESSVDGNNTQVSIEVIGDYDYLAYQADSEYVITVKPLTEEELAARKERFKYVGEKLSLNFQDIKVRAVLEIIADVTGLNLVASDTVDGNITLRLDNVPWDQALDLVLKSKGLDKRQNGNVLLVAPAAEIAERERQEIETRNQLQELAPLRTEFIRIRYANAKDIFELFTGEDDEDSNDDSGSKSTRGILSERGTAIVDERTNSIILTETEDKIEQFKDLIEQVDIPIRQVMIESRIVVANSEFGKEIGVRWGGISAGVKDGRLYEAGGSLESFAGNTGANGENNTSNAEGSPAGFFGGTASTVLSENNIVDLATPNTAGSLAVSFLNSKVLLNLELTAYENSGLAEIVSQPKVITGDKQKATIESGQEIPYQVITDDGIAIQFREAVLKLDVTPQITPDNRVIMDLIINQDSVSDREILSNTSSVPIIDTTELNTKVLVGDGQTIVLGGIFQQSSVKGETKVPFFGDLPFIGRLFKQNIDEDSKQELLIFITPRILSDSLLDN